MEFAVGDIIELDRYMIFFDRGLTAQVLEVFDENWGMVKVLKTTHTNLIGQAKFAKLDLFKLVRKGGLYV